MCYQWFCRYSSLIVDRLIQYRLIKAYNLKSLFRNTLIYFYRSKPDPFPVSFCYIYSVSFHHILDQMYYTIQMIKRILKKNKKNYNPGCLSIFSTRIIDTCPSSNPPFVLSKIQLSSPPEYTYRIQTLFGLSQPRTTVSFQL